MKKVLSLFTIVALSLGTINGYAQEDTATNKVEVASPESIESAEPTLDVVVSEVEAPTAETPTSSTPQNEDLMRSNGKIYVVIAVIAVVLIGLATYLIHLDRKIRKLENEK